MTNDNTNDSTPTQRSRTWITNATPNELADALANGELNAVLNGEHVEDQAEPKPEQVTRDQLKTMTAEQIIAAQRAGQLEDVINRAVDSE